MTKPNFTYNRPNSTCCFCHRTANPHPDFDEPLVTTKIETNNKRIELCINCYFDLETFAQESNKSFVEVVKEKENLLRILSPLILEPMISKPIRD